jgi:hypothetical protein
MAEAAAKGFRRQSARHLLPWPFHVQDAVGGLQGSEAGQAVREQMLALAQQLQGAQEDVASVVNGIVEKFPGPLMDQTLGIIRRQVSAPAGNGRSTDRNNCINNCINLLSTCSTSVSVALMTSLMG